MPRLPPELEPYTPSPVAPFTPRLAAHLLNRAGFGGTREEISQCISDGPAKAISRLLDFPDANADEQSMNDVPDLSPIENYPRTFSQRRELFQGKSREERDQINQELMRSNREAMALTADWWMNRMAKGPYPLQEKLTLFWHGHFTSSARDERSAWLMWQQNETLRRNAAGNFDRFVREISRDPAMLDYLNNQQNRKGAPNENFARELMELFTLGIGNYSENDIKEAARAFTGWQHDGENFVFRKGLHDDGEKSFFGQKGNLEGDDIISLILNTQTSSNYIAAKLWTFFVSETISPAVHKTLATMLRESRYDMRPMLRTMFASRAFFDDKVIGTQIKSPVQLVVGTLRQLEVERPPLRRLRNQLEQMGQVPFNPPNVKGWPGGRAWINTSTLFVRYNTCLSIASGAKLNPMKGNVSAMVDRWVNQLIQRDISPAQHEALCAAMNDRTNEDSVRRLVGLIVSMPEYQLC